MNSATLIHPGEIVSADIEGSRQRQPCLREAVRFTVHRRKSVPDL